MFRAIGVLAVSYILAGCTDTSSGSVTSTASPTLFTVDPLKFRGAVRCGPPGLQGYVVVLTVLTEVTNQPSLVAVSVPATCPIPTSFGAPPIVIGALYTAEIDGYDRPPCDPTHQIFSAGCVEPAALGSRDMLDHTTQTRVARRWEWQCGEVPALPDASDPVVDSAGPAPSSDNSLLRPTQVLSSTENFLQGCRPVTEVPVADASPPNDATIDESDTGAQAQDTGAQAQDSGTDGAAESSVDAHPDDHADGTPNGG